MSRWISSSLSRKFLFALAGGLVATSLVFLLLFVGLYQDRLEQERSEVSAQVSRLLQVSLENAMVKRDLPGLADIVQRLAADEKITSVMIVNSKGEVRFSSRPGMVGHRFTLKEDATCSECHSQDAKREPLVRFTTDEQGREVLRSVTPVHNKPVCQRCHGPISKSPINGVLFVDYDGKGIQAVAIKGAIVFAGSGSVALVLILLAMWWMIRRNVVVPVENLTAVSRAVSSGDLEARVLPQGRDELAQLGSAFDRMAENLKRSLDGLENSKVFLQSLIDGVPDGIRVIDRNFEIVAANQAYCAQVGRALDTVIGTPCYWAQGRDEPCAPTLITCPVHEIQADSRPLKCVHRHVRGDGTELFVEVTAAPLSALTEEGNEHGLVVESIRDVSQQVALSHEHKLSELGQLATGVAHEIHNPLASARLSVQAMRREFEGGTPDMAQIGDYFRVLDEEIDECIDVTMRLLRLGAPPETTLHPVVLNKAVSDVVSLLGYEAEKAGIEISVNMERDGLRTLASESEIRMLVLNIVQNAFHAMPDGGRLEIRGSDKGRTVAIVFEDNGVGIKPDDMPYIFNPFFSRRADGIQGTGLGLAICKAIVDRYDGALQVESEIDQGSRFIVSFLNPDSPENEI